MKTLRQNLRLLLMLTFALGLTGCAREAVIVHDGDVMRIGPAVTGRVYLLNPATGKWELSKNKVTIPEGWYCTDFQEKK
jgi:hypothetical protein